MSFPNFSIMMKDEIRDSLTENVNLFIITIDVSREIWNYHRKLRLTQRVIEACD